MDTKFYVKNIEEDTMNNNFFRKVLYTAKHSQLVVMALQPGEDIGMEVHDHVDQFIRIEQGKGKAILNGQEFEVADDFAFIVPAGTEHNLVNTGDEVLKLYTVYSPANHPEGTIHETKAEADEYEKEHHHEE